MKIIKHSSELQHAIHQLKKERNSTTVGFVPTMGSLHEGHLELVKSSKQKADLTVVSIFVNPTQFNNQKDLDTYPRDLDADAQLLSSVDCDILFAPSVAEVYPNEPMEIKIDLNGLDEVMEGEHRPGHFKGVLMVVKRLFDLVQPHFAFFGRKDFQQLAIIQKMVVELNINLEIVPVEIQRNKFGLALSSRNQLLSDEQREQALILYNTLKHGKELAAMNTNAEEVKKEMITYFNQGELELEYLSIVDNQNLQAVAEINGKTTACIAAYCGQVRLIDNMQF